MCRQCKKNSVQDFDIRGFVDKCVRKGKNCQAASKTGNPVVRIHESVSFQTITFQKNFYPTILPTSCCLKEDSMWQKKSAQIYVKRICSGNFLFAYSFVRLRRERERIVRKRATRFTGSIACISATKNVGKGRRLSKCSFHDSLIRRLLERELNLTQALYQVRSPLTLQQ